MKYIFPAVFRPLDGGLFHIQVPDLPGCMTEGIGLQDAYDMVQDAVAMWVCDAEDSHEAIPAASDIHQIACSGDDFVSLVSVDTTAYRAAIDNRAVKKTLTIPAWMNRMAEEQGVNFSQVLQNALKKQLHMSHR